MDIREAIATIIRVILTEWQSHFDLLMVLFQFAYLYGYPDSSARYFAPSIILIVDSVSWRILIQDFKRKLYMIDNLWKGRGRAIAKWVNEVQHYLSAHRMRMSFGSGRLMTYRIISIY
ncbi:hypothetical protein KCP69_26705 (plasmid) [Salmonella enterica subsp. enterica]|nr:hypothetical protein KCP69_26705 [Salmonella enterica subsp. enterica]